MFMVFIDQLIINQGYQKEKEKNGFIIFKTDFICISWKKSSLTILINTFSLVKKVHLASWFFIKNGIIHPS